MNRNISIAAAVAAAALIALIVFASAAYTLDKSKQAVVLQFGAPVDDPVVKKPGLHFKMPFIQEVKRFEKRLLAWDGDPDQVQTRGRKRIFVDTTARWRIEDPLRFLQEMGTESSAQSKLDDIIGSAVRSTISSTELVEIVRSEGWDYTEEDIKRVTTEEQQEKQVLREEVRMGRKKLIEKILSTASTDIQEFGITLVDFRIKRLNYVESVRNDVFDRMISERRRIAEKFRAEGRGRSSEIQGQTRREEQEILSDAERQAETIRGDADAQATNIYNEAYNQAPDFYSLYRTLESYRDTLGENAVFVLDTDTEYLKFLRDIQPAKRSAPDTQ